jgi:cytochrome c553
MDSSLPALKAANLGDVVAYYASQKPSAGTVSDDKLAAAGKAIYDDGNTGSGVPSCSGCHQPEGEGNARYPRLAGQHATYTMAQMQAFKEGTRTNDKARVMRAVAARMTEQEIAAVAEYIAGL